jgi:hypothetical protein
MIVSHDTVGFFAGARNIDPNSSRVLYIRSPALRRDICVTSESNGLLRITCPTLPEVATFAPTSAEIVRCANEVIDSALEYRNTLWGKIVFWRSNYNR